ncbi:MAG: hotdog fold thioesterase [Flavitalea sp.]
MIWFNDNNNLKELEGLGRNTMAEYIGIEFMEIGEDYLKARMPVDHRTNQPYGLLHGGASCVLAETLGSIASALVIDRSKSICVGLEINANHIRSARKGFVTGRVTPLHIGKSTHVWDIRVHDEEEKLVCISRLTVAVISKK